MKKVILLVMMFMFLLGGNVFAGIETHKDDFTGKKWYQSVYTQSGGFLGLTEQSTVALAKNSNGYYIIIGTETHGGVGVPTFADEAYFKANGTEDIYGIKLKDSCWDGDASLGHAYGVYYLTPEDLVLIINAKSLSFRATWSNGRGYSADVTIKKVPESKIREWEDMAYHYYY